MISALTLGRHVVRGLLSETTTIGMNSDNEDSVKGFGSFPETNVIPRGVHIRCSACLHNSHLPGQLT